MFLVPFSLPSIGPVTCEDSDAFETFEEALLHNHCSSAVWWVVRLRMLLLGEGKQFIQKMKQELRDMFGMKIRNTILRLPSMF